jgi:hypothetical protein
VATSMFQTMSLDETSGEFRKEDPTFVTTFLDIDIASSFVESLD